MGCARGPSAARGFCENIGELFGCFHKVYFNISFFDVILYEVVSQSDVFRFRVLYRVVTNPNRTFGITVYWNFLHVNPIVSKLALNPKDLGVNLPQ